VTANVKIVTYYEHEPRTKFRWGVPY